MITALDTNVLLDILIPNPAFFEESSAALRAVGLAGPAIICDLVYAELCLQFEAQDECDLFLEDNAITVECLTRGSHFLASRIWRDYRRRGGSRNRILPDFLIAAHAQMQADRLITRDRGYFSEHFPLLQVLTPADCDRST